MELDNISPYIQDAVISTEDRGFYQHKGYSIKGIARAVVGKLTSGKSVAVVAEVQLRSN